MQTQYTFIYQFNDRYCGFQNQITVNAQNFEEAQKKAKDEIYSFYRCKSEKYFNRKFSIKPQSPQPCQK